MLIRIIERVPDLGDRIKERRHELGISMLAFALGIDKSKSYVTNLEGNRLSYIDFSTIKKVEKFLDIELIEIDLKIKVLF